MLPVQRFPGHHHVALGAPWVGEVSLLQYNHVVPDMPVKKWTRIAVRVATLPRHPSTGQCLSPLVVGKAISTVHGSPMGPVVPKCRLLPVTFLPCVFRWNASNSNAISSTHSKHCNCTRCLSQWEGPAPVIHLF